MRNLSLVLLLFIFMNRLTGQVTEDEKMLRKNSTDSIEGWHKGSTIFLNLSQTSLTNWAGGGENSSGFSSLVNAFANYKKGNGSWDNLFNAGFGMLKQGSRKLIKTDDRIDLLSKYGQKAFNSCYYAVMLNFRTQMATGYNYPNDSVIISDFLAPGYFVSAIGLDYRRNDIWTIFLAPVTNRLTIVNNEALADSGSFGVEKGKKLRSELGGYIRMAFKKDIMKNVNVDTELDLFSNYMKKPQNIDVNWNAMLTLQANKYMAASISTQLIYDDNIKINGGPKIQFKEILAIGLTLKF
jgi:hypothetical protein